MDLELVCWILWESWRFLWAQTVSRFRTSLVWNGQELVQVARTRPTFINNMDVSSAADTVTNIGSPGMQAYTSANTEPGATWPKILVLPQISLQEITARPDSKIPIFSVIFPSERITSPFWKLRVVAFRQPKRDVISAYSSPRNSCVLDKFIFSNLVVITTDFHSML